MTKIKIGTGDWIVVCDGRKALILENLGDRMFPNLHTREVHEQPNPSTHAQGSDAPGRVHQSKGGGAKLDRADGLARRVGAIIPEDAGGAAGRCRHDRRNLGLTMVASPRALGMIRSDYSAAVRKALHGEVAKDLVKMPVHEIEKQLLA